MNYLKTGITMTIFALTTTFYQANVYSEDLGAEITSIIQDHSLYPLNESEISAISTIHDARKLHVLEDVLSNLNERSHSDRYTLLSPDEVDDFLAEFVKEETLPPSIQSYSFEGDVLTLEFSPYICRSILDELAKIIDSSPNAVARVILDLKQTEHGHLLALQHLISVFATKGSYLMGKKYVEDGIMRSSWTSTLEDGKYSYLDVEVYGEEITNLYLFSYLVANGAKPFGRYSDAPMYWDELYPLQTGHALLLISGEILPHGNRNRLKNFYKAIDRRANHTPDHSDWLTLDRASQQLKTCLIHEQNEIKDLG